jgi:hypothetical protein
MDILKLWRVAGTLASVGLLYTVIFPASASEDTQPWSFVNGSAQGYSVQLVSASPMPGTKMAAGQTVDFKVTVSYELSIAEKGAIILVVQDENNKNLTEGRAQERAPVKRGKGTVTLTQRLVVPGGSNEVRLFIPLVPNGIDNTSGELVLRYPVNYEGKTSDIGYPTVAGALKDLHSQRDVTFGQANGWTIAEDRSHFTMWSFAPAGDPAYPSAVKRSVVQQGAGSTMEMKILCESTQGACDKLVRDFNLLNQRALESVKGK